MLMQEFIDRTGFEPTIEEYREIEQQYYDFAGDKNAFCAQFDVEKANRDRVKRLEEAVCKEAELRKEIERLQAELDRELGWKPAEGIGTNLPQSSYINLAKDSRKLSDSEARHFIANEFGFDADKVRIIHEVSTYEVNQHSLCRIKDTFQRDPQYFATDWYYIRFNVCANTTWQYEAINGNLELYNS